jgi:hypothetical protein
MGGEKMGKQKLDTKGRAKIKTPEPESLWAIVQLMGHVRIAGRISEEEKFGAKIGRLDIPRGDKGEFSTEYFGASSVYRIQIVSEEIARQVASSNDSRPIHSYEMPKVPQIAGEAGDYFDQRPDEDDEVPW